MSRNGSPKQEAKVKVRVVAGKVWFKQNGKLHCVRPTDDNPVIEVAQSRLRTLRGQVEVVANDDRPAKPARKKPEKTPATQAETADGGGDGAADGPQPAAQ